MADERGVEAELVAATGLGLEANAGSVATVPATVRQHDDESASRAGGRRARARIGAAKGVHAVGGAIDVVGDGRVDGDIAEQATEEQRRVALDGATRGKLVLREGGGGARLGNGDDARGGVVELVAEFGGHRHIGGETKHAQGVGQRGPDAGRVAASIDAEVEWLVDDDETRVFKHNKTIEIGAAQLRLAHGVVFIGRQRRVGSTVQVSELSEQEENSFRW